MSFESGPQFLKEKYDLHTKPEVEAAVKRSEDGTNQEDPASRIQAYLDRLENVFNPPALEGHENLDRRGRNLSMLKSALHRNVVIKPEEIPGSYWETQARMARDLGHGDIEVTREMQEQGAEIIVADQESSLDRWVDYLASDDATYPLWLKYFAVRGVVGMSTYDKERHQFNKRDKGTTAPFPDLDREALAYVLDAVEKRQGQEYRELTERIRQAKNDVKKLKGDYRILEKQSGDTTELATQITEKEESLQVLSREQAQLVSSSLTIPQESRDELVRLLQTSDFAKLYVWALEKVTPAEENELLITEGEWVKYEQGSDHMPLVKSLQGHGTGWCTAGESTAKTQLEAGDFYVYYSKDKHGNASVPRAAIRMQESSISEVRGIAAEQNLDPYIAKVVQEKMREFPDGAAYEKKALDMRLLTHVERKAKAGHELDKDDLIFLYEINGKIKGFGYQKDPRIEELRTQRDPVADAPIVFECEPSEIAHAVSEIREGTNAYVGPLEPGIFDRIQQAGIEHVYTAFPEGKVERSRISIGGKTKEQLMAELKEKSVNISECAEDMLNSPDFTTQELPEDIDLVRLPMAALGLVESPTIDQIYARAGELGLELCPAEAGPQRLLDTDHPLELKGLGYHIVTKQIPDQRGDPYVFSISRGYYGLLLSEYYTGVLTWVSEPEFVFRLRKLSQEA